jgi:hypothetical protein
MAAHTVVTSCTFETGQAIRAVCDRAAKPSTIGLKINYDNIPPHVTKVYREITQRTPHDGSAPVLHRWRVPTAPHLTNTLKTPRYTLSTKGSCWPCRV